MSVDYCVYYGESDIEDIRCSYEPGVITVYPCGCAEPLCTMHYLAYLRDADGSVNNKFGCNLSLSGDTRDDNHVVVKASDILLEKPDKI